MRKTVQSTLAADPPNTNRSTRNSDRLKAFTLIELLIVVAIIAILAAIAVPNFLEAQTRAKVSRAKSDLRSLATAMTCYIVDNNRCPVTRDHTVQNCQALTTPISYIGSVEIPDPFRPAAEGHTMGAGHVGGAEYRSSYLYCSFDNTPWQQAWHPTYARKGGTLTSWGPDRNIDFGEHHPYYYAYPQEKDTWGWGVPTPIYLSMTYDPTNGTKSSGDISRAIGDVAGPTTMGD